MNEKLDYIDLSEQIAITETINEFAIIAKTNAKGVIIYANKKFCELSGHEEAELIGKDHRILNSGHHSKEFFKDMWATIKSGKSWRNHIKNKAKDGSYYWVDTFIAPIKDNDGNIVEFISFRFDITKQKELEIQEKINFIEKEKALSFLSSIRDNSAYAIITGSMDGEITSFNKQAQKMLGYTEEEMIGQSPAIFHDISEVIERSKEFSQLLGEKIEPGFDTFVCRSRHGFKNESEWTYIRKDGSHFPVLLSITVLKDKEGNPTGYLGISQDISKKKEMELALENQKQIALHNEKLASIGVLAGGVAHEINNPLAILQGHSTSLKKKIKKNQNINLEDLNASLEKIDKASERIAKIVRSLMSFSKVEGVKEVDFSPAQIVHSLTNLTQKDYKEHNIKLKIDISNSSEEILIHGNPGKFQQILIRLLSNSKDAVVMKPDNQKEITISVKKSSDQVTISIHDNGIGMDEETISKVFDPFFTTKDINLGSGIGLSLVHNFVSEMRGSISIESQTNQGTTISLSFPLQTPLKQAS